MGAAMIFSKFLQMLGMAGGVTAKRDLTGGIGLNVAGASMGYEKPLMLGSASAVQGTAQRLITSPILDGALAPYAWDVTDNSWTDSGGTYINYCTQFGYNPNRRVTNEISAIFQIEHQFRQSGSDPFGCEFHWQWTSADGATNRRPLSAWVSNVDGQTSVTATGAFTWYDSAGTASMKLGETGDLDLQRAASTIRHGTNNAQFLKQRNAAGNAYLSLPYIDSSDRLTLPGAAYFPGTVAFNGAISNALFGTDALFGGNTAIFGTAQGLRMSENAINCRSDVYIGWSSTTHAYDTQDTSISRVSAGVVGIGTGAAGSVNAALQALSYKSAAPSGGTAAVWKLGVAATVSPTAPNRTIELDVGGTTYYIHAKTTNN